MKIIANFIEDKNGKFHNLNYVISFEVLWQDDLNKFIIFGDGIEHSHFFLPFVYETREEATRALISLLGAIEYSNQPKFETNSLC